MREIKTCGICGKWYWKSKLSKVLLQSIDLVAQYGSPSGENNTKPCETLLICKDCYISLNDGVPNIGVMPDPRY